LPGLPEGPCLLHAERDHSLHHWPSGLAKTGPVVMDVPAGAIAGSANDFWQRSLSDLGLTGPDQGKGGKYVFVGPGQEAKAPAGAFVLRSPTFGVVMFYRALDPDPAKAEA